MGTVAHGSAFVLDPRYNGDGMDSDDVEKTEKYISKYTVTADEDQSIQQVRLSQYFMFSQWVRKHRAEQSVQYQLLFAEDTDLRMSPLQFWSTRGHHWPLVQTLALRLFSLCCTSCESERAFSSLGFIHSKLRNSLGVEKADM